VAIVDHPAGDLIERPYRHGGLRRRILPRSFRAGGQRARHELTLHQRVYEAGLATVEPIGWASAPTGIPGLSHYYYYSRYLEGAHPLPAHIETGTLSDTQLQQMAEILYGLHGLGIFHADLNLNNWLVRSGEILLIDFDKATVVSWGRERYLLACILRMLRSAKKLGLVERTHIRQRFLKICCARFSLDPRVLSEKIPGRYFRERFWDRCRWFLSGGYRRRR